jgi:hypothetical protein
MTEYSIDFTCLLYMNAELLPESIHSLHNLRKAHGFINARNSKRQVLHHRTHHTIGIRWRIHNQLTDQNIE